VFNVYFVVFYLWFYKVVLFPVKKVVKMLVKSGKMRLVVLFHFL
jgi:hypothetical protein